MKKLSVQLGLGMCLLLVMALVSGCHCKDPGKVSGWVQDTEGNLVPLVAVTLPDGTTTHTDAHGLFSFETVPNGKQLLRFAYDGYVPASQLVAVKRNELVSVTQVIEKSVDAGAIADAAAGGTAKDGAGNAMVLPGGAVKSGAGKALTGSLHVEITAMDPGDPEDMNLFAGAFSLNANLDNGKGSLEAYAAANFHVTQNGEDVVLEGDANAEIQIVLPADTELKPGDVVAAWHFDAGAGHWEAGAQGTVTEVDGRLVVVVQVSTFGWWCCGYVEQDPHCINGVVTGNAGEPLEGATVVALGLDHLGVDTAVTGADGAYKIYVKPAARVRLDLIPKGGYYVAATATVNTGAPNDCTVKELQVTYNSCISGYVKEEDGAPIKEEQVFSSAGGAAVTDEDGYFCMPAPGNAHCLVYVTGRPPRVVVTPDQAACGDADLVPVQLTVDFPKDGDMVGLVSDNTTTLGRLFGHPEQYHTSSAMLCSGFDGEKFNLLMPGVLEDRSEVKTLHIDLTPQNQLSAYLSIALGPVASNLVFDVDFEVNGLFNPVNPNAANPENVNVENDKDPEGGRIGPLDAGTPVPLTTAATAAELVRPFDFLFGDGKYGTLGFYVQHPLVSTAFNYADTVNYAWPGGVDLGPFTLSGVIPDPISFTAPAVLDHIFDPVDGQLQDLPLAWGVDNNPGDFVTLVLETIVLNSETDTLDFGAAICTLVDDGSYTIPASVLAQLPHLPVLEKDLFTTKAQVNYLFAMRHGMATANVPLLRGDGGNGRAVLVTNSDPTMNFSVAVDFRINLK